VDALLWERRLVMHDRRFLPGWRLRDDEGLDVESPNELLMAFPVAIGLDVALVPHVHVHMLDRPL
jgi:hypothetical protein